jgi:hypothetical protein
MLARPGPIPRGRGWTFEPKLDGFRCLVCTHAGTFRARSRRGWNMTPLLPEYAAALPADVQLDGELVALDVDGRPDFHRLSARMLNRRTGVAVTLFVVDCPRGRGAAGDGGPVRGAAGAARGVGRGGAAGAARRDVRGRSRAVRRRLRARARGWVGEDEEPGHRTLR